MPGVEGVAEGQRLRLVGEHQLVSRAHRGQGLAPFLDHRVHGAVVRGADVGAGGGHGEPRFRIGVLRLAAEGEGAFGGTHDLQDGDVVCVTSKVVSKAEGRVMAGDRAEAVARESRRLVARRGALSIVVNRLGLTMAAAGVDASNVEPGHVVLLPDDPDASARRLRAARSRRC